MAKEFRFDKADYAELLQAERDLHDLLPEIDKAEECGIDCQARRADREAALERISAMKKNYKPR